MKSYSTVYDQSDFTYSESDSERESLYLNTELIEDLSRKSSINQNYIVNDSKLIESRIFNVDLSIKENTIKLKKLTNELQNRKIQELAKSEEINNQLYSTIQSTNVLANRIITSQKRNQELENEYSDYIQLRKAHDRNLLIADKLISDKRTALDHFQDELKLKNFHIYNNDLIKNLVSLLWLQKKQFTKFKICQINEEISE